MSEIKPVLSESFLGTAATCDPVNCDHCIDDREGPCIPWYLLRIVYLEGENENLKSEVAEIKAKNEQLRKQLPEDMEHSTIEWRMCVKGHSTLRATNWIDNGCRMCEIERLRGEAIRFKNKVAHLQGERGAEAEALRVAFEQMAKRDEEIEPHEITEVLDRIDAADALQYGEQLVKLRADIDQLNEKIKKLSKIGEVVTKEGI